MTGEPEEFHLEADAWVDPYFFLTANEIADGYTLAFSPGIINSVGGVPEPSTWAMLAAGFAGLGFVRLYRKPLSSPA